MTIFEDYDLTSLNTFGIRTRARYFVEVHNELDFQKLISFDEYKNNKKLFLGGGSNILFTKDFDGIVVLNKIKGIEIVEENNDSVMIKAMSGVIWHDLVLFAVDREYWGIENLSYIPGTVGAAPMQNIGAYGSELNNVLETVEAYDVETGIKKIFNKEECELKYRDSVFKNKLRDKYFISSITLLLSKIEKKNLTYKVLKDYIEKNNIRVQSAKDISDAVTEIRKSKLPDPWVMGNAGSFFKNVFVEKETLQKLQEKYPEIPFFEEEGIMKIPGGWLIEKCGWKGKRLGNVGIHDKQALVLVNHGGASGREVKEFAQKIIDSVFQTFGLKLVPEVNLI